MNTFANFMEAYGINYLTTILIAFIGVWTARNIMRLIEKGLLDSHIDRSLLGFITTIIRITVYLAVLLIVLSRLGIPLGGIVSAISALTLAIGLAAQDLIGSVANGLLLVTSRLFKIGDYVEIDGIGGTVKEIKLLHTVLTTPDNKVVTIPNKTVFSASVTNYSAMEVRRIDMVYAVDCAQDMDEAKKVIMDLALANEKILSNPEPFVTVKEIDDGKVRILLRIWVRNSDYWPVTWYLNDRGFAALRNNNVEIAFPQVTLSYRKEERK